MENVPASDHRKVTLAQFTAQAAPFAALPAHELAVAFVIAAAGIGPESVVLDVACGPGIVACEIAAVARQVTGLDLTPAMLEGARQRQAAKGLRNVAWVAGEAEALPFADGAFSQVVTRYSFHHLLRPAAALREMVRVCRPGGRVIVVDAVVPTEQAAGYDAFERLRDPSHVHALDPEAMRALFRDAGLHLEREGGYEVPIELEAQLAVSFPEPGGAERLRAMLRADIGVDATGLAPRQADGKLVYRYPIRIFVGRRDA